MSKQFDWGYRYSEKNKPENNKMNTQQSKYIQIDNYYGAHKNFKTDFKNKKYRNVYNQLIVSQPSQTEYRPLYYQDLFVSIVKTIQSAFMGKQNHIQSIVPFLNIGTKITNQFYWLFLKERRVIGNQLTIDPVMISKITNFFTLLIDFSSKIGEYMQNIGDHQNSQKIFSTCYKNTVTPIINSATSNILLLKKCGQFLLHYAIHCLNLNNHKTAHLILKEGLKVQLNLLMILKFNINTKKKSKKFIKKYLSALKRLIQTYLALAIYFQRQNKSYACSSAVLDAVSIQQLICSYNHKTKKWVCDLEGTYIQQKNKYLQLVRVCSSFITKQQLKQQIQQYCLNQIDLPNLMQLQNYTSFSKQQNCFIFKKHSQQIQKKAYFQKYNTTQSNKNKQSQNKTRKQKTVKQVRFNLCSNETEKKVDSQNKRFKQTQQKSQQNNQLELNNCLKTQFFFQQLLDPRGQQNKQFCLGENKKSFKGNWKNQIQEFQKSKPNTQILFGQNFWQFQTSNLRRSKSKVQRVEKRQQFSIKRTGRKLSYNNVNYLQAINSDKQKNGNLNVFLKQNFIQSNLRKRKKDRGLFLHRKNQNPDSLQTINMKIKQWHSKSIRIETDIILKKHKLQQRKNKMNIFQKRSGRQITNQNSLDGVNEQQEISKVQQTLQMQKKNNLYYNLTKIKKNNGIKLFKQFLVQNKNYFNINKIQLFSSTLDLEGQKRYLSFLNAQKPQRFDKYLEKNYWQANKNIQFFINQIKQASNVKPIERNEGNPIFEKTKSVPETGHLQNIQTMPKQLFSTSLKSRIEQIIKYV